MCVNKVPKIGSVVKSVMYTYIESMGGAIGIVRSIGMVKCAVCGVKKRT
jgi:hypothetical protein